ncbi:putative transcription factor C2H2 family [Helianthus annuus]|nr:putative transcription factor C2H2 family [Helianthus annuus]
MAEPPSSSVTPPPPPPPTPPSAPENPDPTQYWCYQCDKRVPIETLPGQADVICFECKNGFVELISVHHPPPLEVNDEDHPAFGTEFLHVLRLIAMAARDDHEPPLPPDDRDGDDNDNDYLRIELDGWDENVNEEDDDDDDVSDDDDNDNEDEQDENNPNQVDRVQDRSDENENEDEQQIGEQEDEEDEDLRRRRQRDVIRLRLRDFASRALSRRHRILDWAEILTGLEDHSVEFRFQAAGERDGYIGNPGDYLDAAGYEALLQTLAESDTGAKRGAPPAASSVVEALPAVKVKVTDVEVCAICKDKLVNNEEEVVKELPCGHLYHGECIVPWLGSRNTCPVCRYELPTDDPEYEEDRKKRLSAMATTSASSDDAV